YAVNHASVPRVQTAKCGAVASACGDYQRNITRGFGGGRDGHGSTVLDCEARVNCGSRMQAADSRKHSGVHDVDGGKSVNRRLEWRQEMTDRAGRVSGLSGMCMDSLLIIG